MKALINKLLAILQLSIFSVDEIGTVEVIVLSGLLPIPLTGSLTFQVVVETNRKSGFLLETSSFQESLDTGDFGNVYANTENHDRSLLLAF